MAFTFGTDSVQLSAVSLAIARPMTRTEERTVHAPDTDDRFAVPLRGRGVRADTRCAHYDRSRDRIAIRFPCCDVFYPCYQCHQETADHASDRWGTHDQDASAVLCGACHQTMAIAAYLSAQHTCPHCGAEFNPGCRSHWDRYFDFVE